MASRELMEGQVPAPRQAQQHHGLAKKGAALGGRQALQQKPWAGNSTAQHNTAQHSTAQHSTAQHSTAQHSTAQHRRQLLLVVRLVQGHMSINSYTHCIATWGQTPCDAALSTPPSCVLLGWLISHLVQPGG
jgi:hypothetical protein